MNHRRVRIQVQGVVQGVGFRPFVYRLATELGLGGWVLNDGEGVTIEVEGPPPRVETFLVRLVEEKPPPALLYTVESQEIQPRGETAFVIRKSERKGPPRVWILPDLATCKACRRELLDPEDRRFHYPFINCTHCGPRFTIIESLPYDRPRTTMKIFPMCPECAREYHDPENRRFHAQPNACAACGPRLFWYAQPGETPQAEGDEALQRAVEAIRRGAIVAVKGLGGFHLVVDATREEAVQELRRRKRRPRKPFALMYPSLKTLARHVRLTPAARMLLTGPQAPILLLERTPEGEREIAPAVAPNSPYLGVFLPYTPLHILLLSALGFPVVATSANRSDDPIEYDDVHAFEALRDLVDGFLTHNRPIRRHADDSVVMFVRDPVEESFRPVMIRRARGYVPLPVVAPRRLPSLLALGGHMNVTFALTRDREVILSQHLGDMDGLHAREVYRRVLEDFLTLYEIRPSLIVHDLHPDYFTTHLAETLSRRFGVPTLSVQHHHAHLAACVLEYGIEQEVLALTWDGTGYGPDRTVWGGEILVGDARDFRRVASLWPFRLPGGERAVKEPWRIALSLLEEAFENDPPARILERLPVSEGDLEILRAALRRGINAPVTTSMGRLFDGVSALLGLVARSTHQAEAAQQLEYAAWGARHGAPFPATTVEQDGILRLDWREMIRAITDGILRGEDPGILAVRFHHTLAVWAVRVAEHWSGHPVVCGGGVFLNRLLDEMLLAAFHEKGVSCFLPRRLPPTDGSLAAGQAWVAAHRTYPR